MKSKIILLLLLIAMFAISGCQNETTVSAKIYDHLEKTVEVEKEFVKHQDELFSLEKKEQELYNEIISLGPDDYEKVVQLSKEAIETLDKRKEYIKLEKESLKKSEEEFIQIEKLMDDIKNSGEKKLVKQLYEKMMNRYTAYEEVYENYVDSIRLTKELYTIFQQEEIKDNNMYSHLAHVNESYDNVLKANEQFNKETILYNSLKEEYYQLKSEK